MAQAWLAVDQVAVTYHCLGMADRWPSAAALTPPSLLVAHLHHVYQVASLAILPSSAESSTFYGSEETEISCAEMETSCGCGCRGFGAFFGPPDAQIETFCVATETFFAWMGTFFADETETFCAAQMETSFVEVETETFFAAGTEIFFAGCVRMRRETETFDALAQSGTCFENRGPCQLSLAETAASSSSSVHHRRPLLSAGPGPLAACPCPPQPAY